MLLKREINHKEGGGELKICAKMQPANNNSLYRYPNSQKSTLNPIFGKLHSNIILVYYLLGAFKSGDSGAFTVIHV